MKKLIALALLFIQATIIGQDLKCEDFLEGEFISTTPQFPGVEWKLTRTKTTQTEWSLTVPQKYLDLGYPLDTLYAKINWIDSCSYNIIYDGSKMELDENTKAMNKAGGISVGIEKIEGRCYFYESKTSVNGNEMTIKGKICKIK
jgi:hypothetical protein